VAACSDWMHTLDVAEMLPNCVILADVRGGDQYLRTTWHPDSSTIVFSHWNGDVSDDDETTEPLNSFGQWAWRSEDQHHVTGGITGSTHTYGVLWSTTGVIFVNDGMVVGSEVVPLTGPMSL
jgi:hypothetical protein